MATNRVLEPCKTKKTKPNLYHFNTFASPGSITGLRGPFRENIRLFLQDCAEISDSSVTGLPTWSTLLDKNGVAFPLYTIEENTQFSLRPFCDHCKLIGWGHHFVSKRRYHLIIPRDEILKGNCFELGSHVLHGLIHCNGFGHLLCINGDEEEDSNCLPKSQIMDLWDRICTILQTRKISVNDSLKERSMELRLLHGIAYRQSWFGRWGYKFGQGSFGVKENQYNKAINLLSTLCLDQILDDFKKTSRGRVIQQIVRSYREVSETQLVTISDLLQFMLDFKSGSSSRNTQIEDNQISTSAFVYSLANIDCRWPPKRLEYALKVIVNLLKDNNEATMSRKDLRDLARHCIGDTGLIDFVLKSIDCLVIENQIIRRSMNPSTNLVEFTIEDVSKTAELSTELAATTFLSSAVIFDSRWPQQRLEQVARVIWNILRDKKGMMSRKTGMGRQELRDLARQYVGDTGLIDFVLKSINGSIVGNQIVCRSRNPWTKLSEFTIEDIFDQPGVENLVGLSPPSLEPGLDAFEDVLFLYKNVLFGYSKFDSVSLASRAVLDSKYFVKEWMVTDKVSEDLMTLTCRVLPSFDELETELTRPLPPGELVSVPPWFTIRDLKLVAQCALRDTYYVMDRFVVRQIGGLKGIEDERVLSSAVESGVDVWLRGYGMDLNTKLRYEDGTSVWTVDCLCGARDDDGEKMVSCDGCYVWQHTRCSNIENAQLLCSKRRRC